MENIVIRRGWRPDAPLRVDNLSGSAFTGETRAHTFRIYAEGDAQMEGSVTGKLLAANGVTVPLTGSLDGGEAVLTLTADCYRAPGQFILTIYTTADSATVCVYCGVGSVMRADSSTVEYPSAAIPDIVALIEQVQAVINSIPADYSSLSAHFPATGRLVVGIRQNQDVTPGDYSVATGSTNRTTGLYGLAVGYDNTVSGWHGVALGRQNVAQGYGANAHGSHLIANGYVQHVTGAFNVPDTGGQGGSDNTKGNYVEIVGNGTDENARSNARTVDWNGNEVLAGTLTAAGVNLNTAVSALQAAVNIATVAETKNYLNIT